MEENHEPPKNLIKSFDLEDERRVWVATYERMQRDNCGVDISIEVADRAVLAYRDRSDG